MTHEDSWIAGSCPNSKKTDVLILNDFGEVIETTEEEKVKVGWGKAKLINHCMEKGIDWTMVKTANLRLVVLVQ